MVCEHKVIVMVNKSGKKLENGAYEVDFIIRCNVCNKELFKISEHEREIFNISKH